MLCAKKYVINKWEKRIWHQKLLNFIKCKLNFILMLSINKSVRYKSDKIDQKELYEEKYL